MKTNKLRVELGAYLGWAADSEKMNALTAEYPRAQDLMRIQDYNAVAKHVGLTGARKIKALAGIVNKVYEVGVDIGAKINSPAHVYEYMQAAGMALDVEYCWVIGLDRKNKVKMFELISKGTISATIVETRDVFKALIRHGGVAACIIVHNHPSGDSTPSQDDKKVTKDLMAAGELMGIKVIDHVIIGAGEYYSHTEDRVYTLNSQ